MWLLLVFPGFDVCHEHKPLQNCTFSHNIKFKQKIVVGSWFPAGSGSLFQLWWIISFINCYQTILNPPGTFTKWQNPIFFSVSKRKSLWNCEKILLRCDFVEKVRWKWSSFFSVQVFLKHILTVLQWTPTFLINLCHF